MVYTGLHIRLPPDARQSHGTGESRTLSGARAVIFKLEDCTGSLSHSYHNFNFVFCVSTMPCKDGDEAMNSRDAEPPCTRNCGADHSESDGQMDSENHDDSDEDLQASKKKQKYRGRREFTLMKRWVTGGKAEKDSEDIERGLFELARDWMFQSKLKKLPGHQPK
jgi:hypothetical protein